MRLLPGAELDELLPELRVEWAQALMEQPPHSMRWLKALGAGEKVRGSGIIGGGGSMH